jgi:hypothetical protein
MRPTVKLIFAHNDFRGIKAGYEGINIKLNAATSQIWPQSLLHEGKNPILYPSNLKAK